MRCSEKYKNEKKHYCLGIPENKARHKGADIQKKQVFEPSPPHGDKWRGRSYVGWCLGETQQEGDNSHQESHGGGLDGWLVGNLQSHQETNEEAHKEAHEEANNEEADSEKARWMGG